MKKSVKSKSPLAKKASKMPMDPSAMAAEALTAKVMPKKKVIKKVKAKTKKAGY